MASNDPQSSKWQLTLNSTDRPATDKEGNTILNEEGIQLIYDHETIIGILNSNFTTLQYWCMSDEKGTNYHTHLYICFSSRVRFSKIKRAFPIAHIEKAKGNVSDNIMYIKKEGKWAGTDKDETSIEGTFEEWGIRPPDSKGKMADMSELYQMVKDGASNSEIITANQDYILCIDKIDKLRTTLLIDEYKGKLRKDLRVIYISGKTNTGKTWGVIEEHGAENIYRITDYSHPFDHYENQSVIAFDEFRSNITLSDMLQYLDIYPLVLPARYSNKYACYTTVYIISNWKLENQYHEKQQNDKESWNAFLRRIHEVRIYTDFKTYTTYDSVKEYMNRSDTFQELTDSDDLPFY